MVLIWLISFYQSGLGQSNEEQREGAKTWQLISPAGHTISLENRVLNFSLGQIADGFHTTVRTNFQAGFHQRVKSSTTTATHVIDDSKPLLFPNPASDYVEVQWPYAKSLTQVIIYDALGRVLSRRHLSEFSGGAVMDLDGYSSGIHLIRGLSDRGRVLFTEKLIIEKN